MTPEQIVQSITVGGAAAAFYWVLKLLVDGKLHTDSEVNGLRQDKIDLLRINSALSDTLGNTNTQLAEVLRLLREEDRES